MVTSFRSFNVIVILLVFIQETVQKINMLGTATTEGTILQAEFSWRIRTTFKWPRIRNENFNSPLFPTNGEDVKWGLKIPRDFWEFNPTLGINVCLIKCPQPTITAKCSINATNEKKILHFDKKKPPRYFHCLQRWTWMGSPWISLDRQSGGSIDDTVHFNSSLRAIRDRNHHYHGSQRSSSIIRYLIH